MEENDSLPIAEREDKPRFGKILRTKRYRWIFYVALMLFGIMVAIEMTWGILDAFDKFPSYTEPGYDNFLKIARLLPVINIFLNACGLILTGFGCWYAGIVDYTLPPNVRRGFIFAVSLFILGFQFFSLFRSVFSAF